MTKQYEKQ